MKRFGKAISQVDPGIHLKIPFVDGIEKMEVRQRKNVEELAAATANQLPIQVAVSINWTVEKPSAMALFINYGGLEQFESRILDPKLRSAAKAALAQFPADQLIRNRQAAVAAIMEEMMRELEDFPLTVNSPQIENIALPPTYQQAVLEKERGARECRAGEAHAGAAAARGPPGRQFGRGQRRGQTPGSRCRSLPGHGRGGGRGDCDSPDQRPAGKEPPVCRAGQGQAVEWGAAADHAGPRMARCCFPSGRGRTATGRARLPERLHTRGAPAPPLPQRARSGPVSRASSAARSARSCSRFSARYSFTPSL